MEALKTKMPRKANGRQIVTLKASLKNVFQFRWKPTRDTAIAVGLGCLVIVSSLGLLLFSGNTLADEIGFFILRDLVMIFGLGFAFPLYYVSIIRKESLSEIGITKQKWHISLVINGSLALLLLVQFMFETGEEGKEILLSSQAIGPIFYIFVAGIFEIVFFYGYLRRSFEKAFGIIPGIVLAALFYSFHHVGFQPEFVKLVFVGLMYASVFRITSNVLIIYPFFWGVGATWDVLVNFGAMEALQGSWIKALITLLLMMLFVIYLKWKIKRLNTW
jgi:membrane protease YdiL (CAAX protease family)